MKASRLERQVTVPTLSYTLKFKLIIYNYYVMKTKTVLLL